MAIGDKIKAVLGGAKTAPIAAPEAPAPFDPDPDFPRDTHPEAQRAAERAPSLHHWIAPGGTGAEIGVFWAHFTPHLLAETRPAKLHLVDPWEQKFGRTYPRGGPVNANRGRLTTAETYAAAHALATEHAAIALHKADPLDFLSALPARTLDWVYMDFLSSYSGTRALLKALLPKMKPTGVILGAGYVWDTGDKRFDTKLAVDEFVAKYGLEFIEEAHYQFVLLQGHTPRPEPRGT